VAIGEHLLDLTQVLHLFNSPKIDPIKAKDLFDQPTLNQFIDQSPDVWHEVRIILTSILSAQNAILRDDQNLRKRCLYRQDQVAMHLPIKIGND
jgi:fumarylacetoacetase